MVNITNGTQHMTVTNGAFKSMFAPLGYYIEGEESHTAPKTEEEYEEVAFEDMTVAELKAYASELGVKVMKGETKEELIQKLEIAEAELEE